MENHFSENLSRLRRMKNLSKKDLAQKVGISEMAIGYYERGDRSPTLENTLKIAEFFGVSLDRIVYGNTDDLEKIDKIQLACADNKITCTIPVGQQDLFVAALPYAGDVINSVMAAVKKVEEVNQPVELTYTFAPKNAQNAKGDNKNDDN